MGTVWMGSWAAMLTFPLWWETRRNSSTSSSWWRPTTSLSRECVCFIYVTMLAKMGHLAKILDIPFLVPFDSAEFCAYYHTFIIFMWQSAETQWPPIFRHPGNSEFKNGSNEIFRIRCSFTFT